jgi:hypothetical protein
MKLFLTLILIISIACSVPAMAAVSVQGRKCKQTLSLKASHNHNNDEITYRNLMIGFRYFRLVEQSNYLGRELNKPMFAIGGT